MLLLNGKTSPGRGPTLSAIDFLTATMMPTPCTRRSCSSLAARYSGVQYQENRDQTAQEEAGPVGWASPGKPQCRSLEPGLSASGVPSGQPFALCRSRQPCIKGQDSQFGYLALKALGHGQVPKIRAP